MESYKTEEIMVSVDMITFNHEKFISQAIEGVLMQKTKFRYELVIGEDCSSDNTSNIVKEYAQKYPDIIKARCNVLNMGMMANAVKTLKECTGKYIALCEGDDYWTDPLKLQKQVDFLEANPNFCIHHHRFLKIDSIGNILEESKELIEEVTLEDYLSGHANFGAQTCTMVFRNDKQLIIDYQKLPYNCDTVLYIKLLSTGGKAKFSNEIMANYRIHEDGAWSMQNEKVRTMHTIKTFQSLIIICKNEKYSYNLFFNLAGCYLKLSSIIDRPKEKKELIAKGLRTIFKSSIASPAEILSILFLKLWVKIFLKCLISYTKNLFPQTIKFFLA